MVPIGVETLGVMGSSWQQIYQRIRKNDLNISMEVQPSVDSPKLLNELFELFHAN